LDCWQGRTFVSVVGFLFLDTRVNGWSRSRIGEARDVIPDSEEEFITEHYWGYVRGPRGTTFEYRVAHPRWRVRLATSARLSGDGAALYGNEFVESLTVAPTSAFLAEGSEVAVFKGNELNDEQPAK